MTDNRKILTAKDIHKSYAMGAGSQAVLRGVDIAVKLGEFLAIMGASGSGKSTLLHILGLLDRPDKGVVRFEGRDVFRLASRKQNHIRNREIGFVFQFYHLLPELNLEENVLLPIMVESSILSWLGRRKQAKAQAKELIETLGLSKQVRQKPSTLSGGERQRTALARALIQKPKLLLADEPTGNLDSAAGKVILELLEKLNKAGQTIIMVTHDPAVAQMADRRVLLKDGRISR